MTPAEKETEKNQPKPEINKELIDLLNNKETRTFFQRRLFAQYLRQQKPDLSFRGIIRGEFQLDQKLYAADDIIAIVVTVLDPTLNPAYPASEVYMISDMVKEYYRRDLEAKHEAFVKAEATKLFEQGFQKLKKEEK